MALPPTEIDRTKSFTGEFRHECLRPEEVAPPGRSLAKMWFPAAWIGNM